MFKDKSLIPVEAIRLAALGGLAQQPRQYAELASEIRHFVSRITGPTLDLVAPPLELLRYEGLIASRTESGHLDDGSARNGVLELTPAGRTELMTLLQAPVRAPVNDIGRLVIALKLRFLDLLPLDARIEQVDMLIEMAEVELARLDDLQGEAVSDGALSQWLDHDRGQAQARLDWFCALRVEMEGDMAVAAAD